MAKNFELGFIRDRQLYDGYPSLGSNYLPNLQFDERIARFLRNNQTVSDELGEYRSAIREFLNGKTIVEKSGLLAYSNSETAFYIYINDLLNATNLTLTLISASDLTNSENVKSIEQPTFEYNKDNGILYIYPATTDYKNYECYFILTADVFDNISLLYSLIYNTNTNLHP